MYKIKLNLKQTTDSKGNPITQLLHIKLMDASGKYIKFAKHTPELIEWINKQELEMDVESVIQSPK